MTGTIARLIRGRGFGFIDADDRDPAHRLFFHVSQIVGGEAIFARMIEGDRAMFDVTTDDSGLTAAVNVRWIARGSPQQCFRHAADLVDHALSLLNMHTSPIDGRFDNFQHAKTHRRLSFTARRLRQEADRLDTKDRAITVPSS